MRREGRLNQLRWLTIVAPFAFLALYYYLMLGPAHHLFHTWEGFALLMAVLAVAVTLFASYVFNLIGRQQATILRQNAALAALGKKLQALNAAGVTLASELELPSVLQRVVDLGRELFGAPFAALAVVDDDGQVSDLLTSGDASAVDLAALRAEDGTPAPGGPPANGLYGVPLRYKAKTVGRLYLGGRDDGAPLLPTPEDQELLATFAVQAATAVENGRLYREVQALATETERNRIAREMHDGMAQVLAYVNAKAQAVSEFLAQGRHDDARHHLGQLAEAVRGVYADVREAILGLRLQLSPDRTLVYLLREYLEEYEMQSDIRVELVMALSDGRSGLDSLQEIQVVRIVQEALANVRQHSGADRAEVRLEHEAERLRVTIRDNGRGFDPAHIARRGRPHFGLQTMQERAESIGGRLVVESAPGEGTAVVLEIPRESRRPEEVESA